MQELQESGGVEWETRQDRQDGEQGNPAVPPPLVSSCLWRQVKGKHSIQVFGFSPGWGSVASQKGPAGRSGEGVQAGEKAQSSKGE